MITIGCYWECWEARRFVLDGLKNSKPLSIRSRELHGIPRYCILYVRGMVGGRKTENERERNEHAPHVLEVPENLQKYNFSVMDTGSVASRRRECGYDMLGYVRRERYVRREFPEDANLST
jgi:hypothetical protein